LRQQFTDYPHDEHIPGGQQFARATDEEQEWAIPCGCMAFERWSPMVAAVSAKRLHAR
jgi:hypothetical protein